MDNKESRIDSLENSERVTNPSAIYEDIEDLPEWWQSAVIEFQSYELRTYQPSQFTDGEIVYKFISQLEDEYDVNIELKAKNPPYDGDWKFVVDGTTAIIAPHSRKPEGYTEYGISSEDLDQAVSVVVSSE